MNVVKSTVLIVLLSFYAAGLMASQQVFVKSPNGQLVFSLSVYKDMPVYGVSYRGQKIIDNSGLSLLFKENGRFAANLDLIKSTTVLVDDRYELAIGKTRNVHNPYRQLTLSLREKLGAKRLVNIIVRAFNDGVAFRYEFPEQANWGSYTLTEERTCFNVLGNPRIRTLLFGNNYNNNHEGVYQKMNLAELKENVLMDVPVLFELTGKKYLAITEASLRNYAGMYLVKENGVLRTELSPLQGQTEIKVKAILPHQTPWRVMMISDQPGTFLESNMLTSLNEPSEIKDVSWLKPGKTSFHWWNGDVLPDSTFAPGVNFETNKYYIDFCARNNIEYHSVIGYGGVAWYSNNWPSYAEPGSYADVTKPVASLDMQRICDYAKQKGVAIHVWVNWKALYPQLEAAFTQFEKWGIKGMMVDFLDRSDQEMVKIQEEILDRAAAHHLFIQFHGAYKPTGMNRTYPNEFTREGTHNYEQNKWLNEALSPEHDLDIAFTRMIAGASDYHLGGFRAVKLTEFKPRYIRPLMVGTRSHMLAMYVVMESYLNMVADYPEAYEGQPGFEFLRQVPTVWDETKVVKGVLDEYLTIARRHGNDWFLGTLNNSTHRTLEIPLSFLGEGDYKAEIYGDAIDSGAFPNKLDKTTGTFKKGDIMTVKLAAGGGNAIRFTRSVVGK
ncbi:MAG: glycoside hydrolase family 97 protein [Bacteroidota bacterium]